MLPNKLQLLAVWLCTLIISIPLAVAVNTVNVQSISGQEGISGVRAKQDQLQVTALVSVQEGDTTDLANQLLIIDPSGGALPFDSCAGSDGSFSCEFSYPEQGTDTKSKGRTNYQVLLFPNQPEAVRTAASIAVDGEGPRVDAISADTAAVSGGTVGVTYTVTDTACPGCTKCAGVDKIDIYTAEDGRKVGSFAAQGEGCTITETQSVAVGNLPNGEIHLCAVPLDRFQQYKPEYRSNAGISVGGNCVAITKDDTQPEIVEFRLTYAGTETPVDYISNTGSTLMLKAEVKTGLFPLEQNRIRVDLSQLGGAPLIVPCADRFGHGYICEAEFRALITESGNKAIPVTIADDHGNTVTQSFSGQISVDNDTPAVQRFETGYTLERDGTTVSVLGRRNNTFIVELQESGSGFDTDDVYVDIAGAHLQMDCEGNTCIRSGYDLSGGTPRMAVSVRGADDVGHAFSATKTFDVDVTPPQLQSITLANSNLRPYLVEGDDLIVTAKLQDNTGISPEFTTADFGNFSANYNPHPNCVTNSSGNTCQWVLFDVFPAIRLSGRFRFADAANNALEQTIAEFPLIFEQNGRLITLPAGAVAIARNANATTANFWTPQISEPMPKFLDEDIAQVVSYRMWWDIGFKQRGGLNAKIVDTALNPAACTGGDFNSYVNDLEVLYTDPANLGRFMVKVAFKRGGIQKEALSFSCPVGITTVVNNAVYPQEVDSLNFTIPVTRAGEISGAVRDEIDRVRGSWLVKAKWIGTITKWLTMGKNICNLLSTLGHLISTLQLLGIKMEWAHHNPLTKPMIVAYSGTVEGATEGQKGLYTVIDKFCKWISCRTGFNKWYGNFVNSHTINNLGKAPTGPTTGQKIKATGTIWPADPSQSLILSMVAMCIPGIFFNLQKARQIECQYLACLHDQAARGTPIFVCSKLRNYGWCRYIMGEIFQLIPFAAFFQSFAAVISALLANPINAFLGISSWICAKWIPVSSAGHGFCHQVGQVVLIGDLLADIKALKDTDWKLSKDACKEVLDRIDDDPQQESERDPEEPEDSTVSALPDRGSGVSVG